MLPPHRDAEEDTIVVNVRREKKIGIKLKSAIVLSGNGAVISQFSKIDPIGDVERSRRVVPGMRIVAISDTIVENRPIKDILRILRRAHRLSDITITFRKQKESDINDDEALLRMSPRTYAHRKLSLDADSGKFEIRGHGPAEDCDDEYCVCRKIPFVPTSWQGDGHSEDDDPLQGPLCSVQ